jgi:hypothetical protein
MIEERKFETDGEPISNCRVQKNLSPVLPAPGGRGYCCLFIIFKPSDRSFASLSVQKHMNSNASLVLTSESFRNAL